MTRMSVLLLLLLMSASAWAQSDKSLSYLKENRPWYPHTHFPKLITPQWVGEKGVDAVVILAIDDMRSTGRYESFLRPILERLKKIDGRGPVSIMTNSVNIADPQLQRWIKEGLSIEVHTIDHPCPLLNGGNLARAKSTYDRCVDLLSRIGKGKVANPVAFRMPCCDSLNTVSPRFFSQIFDKKTPGGNFLQISSSVFNTFTPRDKSIPRELLYDEKGRERFDKYIPHQSNASPRHRFINWVENYPYPYVINRTCWEFPCVVPSDWEGQNLHRPNNPITLADMKAALDITVHKKGVYCLVFHPHGWIRSNQMVDLIDHAVRKHGKKVKFLNFPEALQRLNRHLLAGQPLRDGQGRDNGVRLLDMNRDGYLDVVVGNKQRRETRIWRPDQGSFAKSTFPSLLTPTDKKGSYPSGGRFLRLGKRASTSFLFIRPLSGSASGGIPSIFSAHTFEKGKWTTDSRLTSLFNKQIKLGQEHSAGSVVNVSFETLTDDSATAVLVTRKNRDQFKTSAYRWHTKSKSWRKLEVELPGDVPRSLGQRSHPRVRFVDLDEDGNLDVVHSPQPAQGQPNLQFWLMDWSTGHATRVAVPNSLETMPLLRGDGTDNGFFVRDRHLCWQNEDTNRLPHLLRRVSFDAVLHQHLVDRIKQGKFPPPRSAEKSAALIQVRPGLRVELVASEPLIRDPVAFDWDVKGRLWVVEMGGYPNGAAGGSGKGVGRIRVLTDTNQDGRFDRATTFLDGIRFPNGIQLWRKGVLVTAAPEIFYAEDSNGDGKADVRKTLYKGFVEGNQQHRVNGLRWGLDNWLYVANGDSGGKVAAIEALSKAAGPLAAAVSISGRDLRIRPDEGKIEPQSGQTQFGRNRDDWGNWFGCNNSNPMWQYVLADHYLRGNPHAVVRNTRHTVPLRPGAAPVYPISRTLPRYNDFRGVNRFTSACSTTIYRDRLLGSIFYGDAFTSEPVHNLISRLQLTPSAATFSGRRASDESNSEFLASRDNWFRPTMIRTGPDGALWIADMYRAVIEHPKWIPGDWQKRLDLRAGHKLGRIYRVVAEDAVACCQPGEKKKAARQSADQLRCFFKTAQVTSRELVGRLASPNGWWRDTAQRMLVHRQDKSVVTALQSMAGKHASPLARLHALCTFAGLKAVSAEI